MTKQKSVPTTNYSPEQIATMTAMYTGEDNVNEVKAISGEIDKPVNSVRAKLSSLGVYVKADVVKASTSTKITKAVKAAEIAVLIGANMVEQEALAKTTAPVLDKLLAKLTNS